MTSSPNAHSAKLAGESPFTKLATLINGIEPGRDMINLSVGEPQHAFPAFVPKALNEDLSGLGKYPAVAGTPAYRGAVSAWLAQRYSIAAPDPDREIAALCGSREGLFFAAITAAQLKPKANPVALLPNPFYQAYGAGILATGAEPVLMPTTQDNNYLPDIEALPDALLSRVQFAYYGTPSNPAGTVASQETLDKLASMARKHDFLLFSDECYSEIYDKAPPAGILELGSDKRNLVAFNSLSKRSNLPGLRCGFAAGDEEFIQAFIRLRNLCAPQTPIPVQNVAIAAFADESHVEENRALYRQKFDIADELLGHWAGYRRPEAGFFLWLNVAEIGGGEHLAKHLWEQEGLRTVPGGYLGRTDNSGNNPGDPYLRIALVDDLDRTREALSRLKRHLKN